MADPKHPYIRTQLVAVRKVVGRIARRLPLTRSLIGQQRNRLRESLLEHMPKESVCAEIGVWKGDFSQMILDVVQPKMLHLIDPWSFQDESPARWFGGGSDHARRQSDMDGI